MLKQAMILLLFVLATILAPLPAFTQTNEDAELFFKEQDYFAMLDDQTKKLYNDAMDALGNGERVLATMYMEKALARIGRDDGRYKVVLKGMVICYQQLALYYYNYNSLNEAIGYLNKILSLIGNDEDAFLQQKCDECYAYLGKIYYEKKNRKKAQQYLNILKRRDTPDAPTWAKELESTMRKPRQR